ncbi:MAG: D-alanyl-D-alanine carboxypeptidase family protein [Clostridia bacterium]
MKKTVLILMMIFLCFSSGVSGAEESPSVKADAALIYDMDEQMVLWQKEGNTPMAPASLIKVLNLLTAEPYLAFEEEIVIGPLAQTVYNGQLMGLSAGDVVKTDDLIYAMMLFSANDAAVAIADELTGNISFYAALMDTKAWALGAVHTTSVNVNGYSEENQKTTAYDLAVIGTAFMDNERLAGFAGARSHRLQWLAPEKEQEITNINKFLFSYEGATGLKTGTTSMAGKCLMASVEKNGKRYLAVALNSSDRYGDCIRMMDYAYQEEGALSAEIVDDME